MKKPKEDLTVPVRELHALITRLKSSLQHPVQPGVVFLKDQTVKRTLAALEATLRDLDQFHSPQGFYVAGLVRKGVFDVKRAQRLLKVFGKFRKYVNGEKQKMPVVSPQVLAAMMVPR